MNKVVIADLTEQQCQCVGQKMFKAGWICKLTEKKWCSPDGEEFDGPSPLIPGIQAVKHALEQGHISPKDVPSITQAEALVSITAPPPKIEDHESTPEHLKIYQKNEQGDVQPVNELEQKMQEASEIAHGIEALGKIHDDVERIEILPSTTDDGGLVVVYASWVHNGRQEFKYDNPANLLKIFTLAEQIKG